MTGPRLTAPACKILSVLHLVDPAAPWITDVNGDESTCGTTLCGIPMLTVENWQLLEQLPGERLCVRCTGDGFEPEQETLL